MRKFIYKEDAQMRYYTPVLFETDAELSTTEMESIAWDCPGAGRISVSFGKFKDRMNQLGHVVREIERRGENGPLSGYPVVVGPTGNY